MKNHLQQHAVLLVPFEMLTQTILPSVMADGVCETLFPNEIILNDPLSGRGSRLHCSNDNLLQKRNNARSEDTCIVQLAINPINERRETSVRPRKAGDSGGV